MTSSSLLHGARSVAVFRALQLGDMLCAVPALRALRSALSPAARVTLIGLPWARDFAARFAAYLHDFVEFPGHAGLPEREPDLAAWPGFVASLRARRFDLALQLHGDGCVSNAIVDAFGATRRAGFAAEAGPGRVPWPSDGSEVERLLSVTAALGAPLLDTQLEFPLTPGDRAELAATGLPHELRRGGYVCLHPGARWAGKRWPVASFAAVGRALHDRFGLQLVLTGSAAERPLAAEVASAIGRPCVNAALPISIGAMAALIASSRLLVANDTGVSHIAAGLAVPSVIVFSASDLERWAPLDRTRHRPVPAQPEDAVEAVLRQAGELLALPHAA